MVNITVLGESSRKKTGKKTKPKKVNVKSKQHSDDYLDEIDDIDLEDLSSEKPKKDDLDLDFDIPAEESASSEENIDDIDLEDLSSEKVKIDDLDLDFDIPAEEPGSSEENIEDIEDIELEGISSEKPKKRKKVKEPEFKDDLDFDISVEDDHSEDQFSRQSIFIKKNYSVKELELLKSIVPAKFFSNKGVFPNLTNLSKCDEETEVCNPFSGKCVKKGKRIYNELKKYDDIFQGKRPASPQGSPRPSPPSSPRVSRPPELKNIEISDTIRKNIQQKFKLSVPSKWLDCKEPCTDDKECNEFTGKCISIGKRAHKNIQAARDYIKNYSPDSKPRPADLDDIDELDLDEKPSKKDDLDLDDLDLEPGNDESIFTKKKYSSSELERIKQIVPLKEFKDINNFPMIVSCSDGFVCNPFTGKCIATDKRKHRELVKYDLAFRGISAPQSRPSSPVSGLSGDRVAKSCPPCSDEQICNKSTGKCVKRFGKVGLSLDDDGYPKAEKKSPVSDKNDKNEHKKDGKKEGKKSEDSDETNIENKKISEIKNITVKEDKRLAQVAENFRKEQQPENFNVEKCINKSKIPLLPYQKKAALQLLKQRGLVIAHSLGSGKTLTSIAATECLLEAYPDKEVLVITPASLGENFYKGLREYGLTDTRKYHLFSFQKFYLDWNNKTPAELKEYLENKIVIIDEAHNLKYYYKKKVKSSRTLKKLELPKKTKEGGNIVKLFNFVGRYCFKIILLTGTPVMNRPMDLISLVSIIDGTGDITAETFYKYIYDIKDDGNELKEKFNDYFGCKFSIFNRDQNSKDYPKRKNFVVKIGMNKQILDKYNSIELEVLENENQDEKLDNEDEDDDFDDDVMRLIRGKKFYNHLRVATNNLAGVNNPKLKWINKFFDDMKKDDKTVIYSNYKQNKDEVTLITHIINSMKERNIPFKIIDGDTKKSVRGDIVRAYNNNNIKVLLITKAGGEGIDLKGTRNIVIVEPFWNRSLIEQVIGRGIRYKSHSHLPEDQRYVNVYELLLLKPKEVPKEEFDKELFGGEENEEFDVIESLLPHSVDSILFKWSEKKKKKVDEFLKRLTKISIEQSEC